MRLSLWHLGGLLLGVGCLAGCATRADLLQVQQDQHEVRALVADQQVAIEGLRRRVDILRSEVEERGGHGGASSPQVLQRLDQLDARVAALEQGRVATPPPVVGVPSPVVPVAPTPSPQAASPQEMAVAKELAALRGTNVESGYRDALNLIAQGQCDQAVPKLRDFIRRNPKSDLDDNAQYWIGSCYYNQKDYNRAIIELNEVLLKYPKGDKVPAALLMLADAFADSGDKIDARLILQKLISDHPRSEEAAAGREKLKSLGD